MRDDVLDPPFIWWMRVPVFDDDGVQVSAGLDQLGREHGDPVPVSPPVGFTTDGDELHRSIKNLFRREAAAFQAAVEAEQFESEAEANDFAVEDDMFPPGVNEPWEDTHEFPEVPPSGGGSAARTSPEPPNGESRAAEHATPQPPALAAASGVDADHKSQVTVTEKSPRGEKL